MRGTPTGGRLEMDPNDPETNDVDAHEQTQPHAINAPHAVKRRGPEVLTKY